MSNTANYFLTFGADAAERARLKFVRGEFFEVVGKVKTQVPTGTKMVVNLQSLATGRIMWPADGGKPDKRLARVAAGERINEDDLPLRDQKFWERDSKGTPIDPFKPAAEITMANPETGLVLVFETQTAGGIKALKRLAYLCGVEMEKHEEREGQFPVVTLETGGYEGSNGWVDEPKFTIAGWLDRNAGNIGTLSALTPLPKPAPKSALAAPEPEPAADLGEPPAYLDEVPPFDPEDDPSF
jgi:hypothetical protein